MTLKNNALKMAIFAGMLGAMYLPQASADPFVLRNDSSTGNVPEFVSGTVVGPALSIPSSIDFANNNVGAGLFSDTYTFNINAAAILGAIAQGSGTTTNLLNIVGSLTEDLTFSSGVILNSITLLDLSALPANQLIQSVPATPDPGNPVTTSDGYTSFSYSAYFSNAQLQNANDTYQLIISGSGGDLVPNNYKGTLIFDASNQQGSTVPEPEEWAMLLIGLPMMGWVVRRKSAGNQNNEFQAVA